MEKTAFDRTVTAVAADAIDAKHLSTKRGTPLLRTVEIFSCRKGVAGVFLSRYRPAYIQLHGRFDFTLSKPAANGRLRLALLAATELVRL